MLGRSGPAQPLKWGDMEAAMGPRVPASEQGAPGDHGIHSRPIVN